MKRIVLPLFLTITLYATSIEQLFNVETIKVTKETIAFSERFWGLVTTDDARVVEVTPRFSGYVTKLFADRIYQKVRKGQPLATIYSPEVFRAKEEYINALAYAKRRGDRSMVDSARRKLRLYGVSASEIVACKKSHRATELTTIYAPTSGYLFFKRVNEGSAFKKAQTLFRIVDLDHVWVETKIPEDRIAKVLGANRFIITPKATSHTYEGKNPTLYPTIDPKEALATLRLTAANDAKTVAPLLPGMFVRVDAETKPRERLTLPREAVIRKMDRWYVFKKGEFEGEYDPVEVKVEPIDNRRYAVLSGLEAGDEVAASALFLLDSDAQINGLW